ncbi:hypothetical protein PInf_021125 [Phytophthora infestans]|nr:hypothetical protein PInf_021125 [Phytophthora infestans]
MPRGTSKSGAKTRSKAVAGKLQAKSAKPHGKGIDSAGGAAAVGKRASKRYNNRPSPRFAERGFNSGSEDEAESGSTHEAPVGSLGGHSPVPSKHKDASVQSLASDHDEHSPRTAVHSESPAVKAEGTPKAGADEEEKPRKHLSLAESLARAKAAIAEGAKLSKKRTASKSPLREKKETGYSYWNLAMIQEQRQSSVAFITQLATMTATVASLQQQARTAQAQGPPVP